MQIVIQNPNRDYLVGKAIEELRIYNMGDPSPKHLVVAAKAIILALVFHHAPKAEPKATK